MSLPLKTAAVITSIFTALLMAVYLLFSRLILSEFATIDIQRATSERAKVIKLLAELKNEVTRQTLELSEQLKTRPLNSPDYKERVLPILNSLGSDNDFLVSILLSDGKTALSGSYINNTSALQDAPAEIIDQLKSNKQLLYAMDRHHQANTTGYIRLNNEPYIVSALGSTLELESESTRILTIIAVRLSERLRSSISDKLGISPTFEILPELNKTFSPSAHRDTASLEISESEIVARSEINDLNNQPLLRITLKSPREIYTKGTAALKKVLFLLALFLVLGNYVTLLFLRTAVLNPIKSLSMVIRQITSSGNLKLRVKSNRADEIGLLAQSFDSLLQNTEESYDEMLKAQRAAESANSGKSLFIAKVSHELRTPIHCITGMLRILFKQEQQLGKRQYIQMAQDSAEGLLSTINEILDFSKMEAGELALEIGQFNLPNTIRACIHGLIPRFEEKHGLELCWDIAPGIPELVLGDSHRLRNIFTNLLGNAYKFTDRGAVSFTATIYESNLSNRIGVRFEIKDSGIGIPEHRLSHIFDPFTQADDSTARLYGGSGLGLAIVKQIAEKMDGNVRVESSVGKGSIFTVDVPFETVGEAKTGAKTIHNRSRSVALLAKNTEGAVLLAEGLQRYGISCQIYPPQDPRSFSALINEISSFDLVINSGSIESIANELTPLIKKAQETKIPFIMSVPSCEMALTDKWKENNNYFLIQKPIGAIDVSLILEGRSILTGDLLERDKEDDPVPSLHIIIADDAPTNRIILSNLLEEAGHTVEVVDNGKKLLDKIRRSMKGSSSGEKSFDIVMTDIQMPIMDGFTASQKIRESEKELNATSPIPIVAVTAYTLPGEAAKMRAAGIDHILTKPISPKKLAILIAEISEQIGATNRDSASAQSQRQDDQQLEEDQEDRELIEELCRITERVSKVASSANHSADQARDQGVEIARHETNYETTLCEETTIDIKDVFERSGNSLRRTNLILSGFLSAYKDPADWLEKTALAKANPSDVRRATHSLKGLLLDVGAVSAAKLAGDLEHQIVTDPKCIESLEFGGLLDRVKVTATLLESLIDQLPKDESIVISKSPYQ